MDGGDGAGGHRDGTEDLASSPRGEARDLSHIDVTPHTLAPEDYHKSLSSEPGLYTICNVRYPDGFWLFARTCLNTKCLCTPVLHTTITSPPHAQRAYGSYFGDLIAAVTRLRRRACEISCG